MEIKIRPAESGDLDFVAALEAEIFSLPESREDFALMLTDGTKHLLVALLDGELAGYIGAYTVCRESDIMTVAVSPDFRKRGIGRALVTALSCILREESDALFLEVRESNTAARTLYASLGFIEVGMRKNYYKLPTENAILCKKEL